MKSQKYMDIKPRGHKAFQPISVCEDEREGRSLRGCVLVGVLGVKYRQAGGSTEMEHNN